MSARREKRLRKLERRVEAVDARLKGLEEQETARTIQRATEEYWKGAAAPYQTVVKATPYEAVLKTTPPRRSLWRRLLDAITGRDGS